MYINKRNQLEMLSGEIHLNVSNNIAYASDLCRNYDF